MGQTHGRDVAHDQIIRAATRLFAARGFDGASLQDIASAVGIRKPSLLYHFPSKEALRQRVLETVLGHWNDVLPRLLVAATSGEGQFDAVLSETLSFFTADTDRARLLLREVLDRPDEMGDLIAAKVQPWMNILCDYIRRGQSQGVVRPDVDPEAYLIQVLCLVLSGLAVRPCLGPASRAFADGGDFWPRHLAELQRIAKSSLFAPAALAQERKT
jgi:TetR/AcrR family transcriptional regulator